MAKLIDGSEGKPGEFRRGLMLYGSTAALAAALMLAEGGVGPALAQEIGPRISPTVAAQGDFTVPGPTPSPTFEVRSGSLDIVSMNRDAVLNWTTYDAAAPGGAQGNSYVNFLPADTELRFVGNGESFTAINRVFTTPNNAGNYRGIAFQGRVTSYLSGDGPNSVGPVGGNVWFFSPGGILATGSAVFNVGSLLLSASDLDNFSEQGSARYVDFTGVVDPFASVILQQGTRVTLTQPNSSFTIVAPTIEQGGDVTVSGSVLYLSAEEGSLFFNSFGQISASVSTDAQAGNRITHLGTTTGPASIGTDDSSIFDPQTIEFRTGQDVGVLLSGSIGYAPATDAALGPNGTIVLTAGSVASSGDLALSSNTIVEAEVVNLTAATGDSIAMGSDANGAYRLQVEAQDATFAAAAGGVIDIRGDVAFRTSSGTASYRLAAAAAAGNTPGGRISVGDNLLLESTDSGFSGASQQGGDIEVTIGDGGAIAVGGTMTLRSDGYAIGDDGGVTTARGGRAVLAMTGPNASLSVGQQLTISAQARPSFQNCECFPPPSGSATGGYAALTATGGTIAVGSLSVSASAEAFTSFYAEPDADLDATGGTALVSLGDSTASFSSIGVYADAQGASGQGADGGDALGGSASFSKGPGGALTAQGIVVTADASGGEGGNPNGDGLSATRGGDAEGGTASIALAQIAQDLGYLDLSARAQAGAGGDGTEFSSESGADGGDARGGTASLTLSGEGTNLSGILEGSLNVSASAGSGGDGEGDYDNAVEAGDGGHGGSVRGGSLTITAADGAEFAWGLNFGLGASAGEGGEGGNQIVNDFGSSSIGQGGRGGDAMGATVAIIADGGLIAGDLELDVRSYAGAGGRNGLDFDGGFTGSADFGLSTGGSIALIARDNGASRFEVGSASLEASGDIAGLVAITDESTDPAASMRFGSLAAYVYGEPEGPTSGFTLSAVANAIAVEETAEIYATSIALDFAGSGRFEVGGFAFLNTQDGDLTISHADNPGVLSLHASGAVEVYANGNYLAGPGSVVASSGYASIRATGSIAADDTRGLGDVFMSAQGDVSVGNIAAGANVELFAGRIDFDGSLGFAPSARATVTGTVSASGSVAVTSGGFAEFASGSQVLSDNDITVRTGDDIILASGASLTSDINPNDLDTLRLLAGDINFGPFDGDLIEPIGTPIASLRIAGTLDTNGASLFLSGDAIDASGSAITTGNLTVDVTDAPPFGPFSNDGGLLGDLCRQGSACLGSFTATGDVEIGLDSNNGLISLRTGTIDFSGDRFAAETLERLDLNPDNAPSSLIAGQLISLRSINDVVALTGVTLEAPTLELRAGTDLAAGTATLIGSDSLLIEVGNDLIAGAISAGNGLDDGSDSGGPFTVPGAFIVGSLTYGGGTDMRIAAGRDISLGFADPAGAAIDIRAQEALFLGSTSTNSGAIRLDGGSVAFNNLRSSGAVYVTAGAGGISGLSEDARVIDTAAGIALETSGDVEVGDLFGGTDIAISGATVSAYALSAGGSLAVAAEGAGSVGSFASGGYAVFTGASYALGNGNAGSFLAVQATDGDIGFGTLGAAGAGTLQASGAISGGDVTVGGELTLIGASLAMGNAEGGAGIGATIDGDVSFGSFTSAAGAVSLQVGGAILGGSVTAATDTTFDADSLSIGQVTAGGTIGLSVNSVTAGSFAAGGDFLASVVGDAQFTEASAGGTIGISARSLTVDTLTADAGLDVLASEAIAVGNLSSGGDTLLSGATLDLGSGTVGGVLTAQSSAGDISFTDLAVDGDADLSASGSLLGGGIAAGGTLTLSGTDMTLDSAAGAAGLLADIAGDAFFGSLASSGGAIALDAAGSARGGFASAAGAITIAGTDVNLDFADFGEGLVLDARTGFLTGSGLYEGTGATSLQAARGISIGSVDALGTITMTAGAGAQFIELRSRDGSVNVNAGLEIGGSSVAATGSDPAGDDSVSLIAGRGILLDGAVTSLNPVSSAQDDFIAQAARTLIIGRVEAGRDLSLTAGEGTLSAVNVASGRDLSLTGPAVQLVAGSVARNLTVRATGGDITGAGAATAGGAVDLAASGNIAIGALAANGGDLTLASGAGGSIAAGNLSTARNLTAAAGSQGFSGAGLTAAGALELASAGDATFTSAAAGTSLDIDAAGAIGGGTVSAGGSANLDAGGALTLTGLAASNAALRSTGGAVSASGVAVSGSLDVRGTAVTLAAPGALQVDARASAGNIAITTGGELRVDATATGDIALNSTGGSVIIGSVGQSGGSSSGIGAEGVSNSGAAVSVTAANAISVAETLTAGGALSMTAGGIVSLDGAARGQTIDLRAGDLAIGSGGTLGGASTQRISLASTNAVNLGSGANGGFAVDAAEFGRIQSSGDLLVTALAGTGSGAGSLTVGSLTVNAGSGGQIGASSTLGLTANGLLDVNNTLSIARAGSGNTLMLTGDAVDLDYANAALTVLDPANAVTGRIIVNGRLITSLSAAAAADIVGKPPAEINTRLGLADVVREIGLFRTANLALEGRDAILIQNSGGAAVDDRRGLNVGALTITGAANGQTLVVINGIIANATGIGAAQNVAVTTPIAGGSSVNGCVLTNIAACVVIPEPEPPLIAAPASILLGTSDLIEQEEEDDEVENGVADGETDAPPIDTTRIDDPAGLPMIDDPVTGAGNEDLWQPPDDRP